MGMVRYYIYHGETLSMKQIADASGINYTTLVRRLKSVAHYTDITALATPPEKFKMNFQGRTVSLSELSREVGISYMALLKRIEKSGLYFEGADISYIDLSPVREPVIYLYHGQRLALYDIAQKVARPYNSLKVKLGKLDIGPGADISELVDSLTERGKSTVYLYHEQRLSLYDIAKKVDRLYSTLKAKLVKLDVAPGAEISGLIDSLPAKKSYAEYRKGNNAFKFMYEGKLLTLPQIANKTTPSYATLRQRAIDFNLEPGSEFPQELTAARVKRKS